MHYFHCLETIILKIKTTSLFCLQYSQKYKFDILSRLKNYPKQSSIVFELSIASEISKNGS